jgi:hypothetical protein
MSTKNQTEIERLFASTLRPTTPKYGTTVLERELMNIQETMFEADSIIRRNNVHQTPKRIIGLSFLQTFMTL